MYTALSMESMFNIIIYPDKHPARVVRSELESYKPFAVVES